MTPDLGGRPQSPGQGPFMFVQEQPRVLGQEDNSRRPTCPLPGQSPPSHSHHPAGKDPQHCQHRPRTQGPTGAESVRTRVIPRETGWQSWGRGSCQAVVTRSGEQGPGMCPGLGMRWGAHIPHECACVREHATRAPLACKSNVSVVCKSMCRCVRAFRVRAS